MQVFCSRHRTTGAIIVALIELTSVVHVRRFHEGCPTFLGNYGHGSLINIYSRSPVSIAPDRQADSRHLPLTNCPDVQECPAVNGGGSAQPITARLTVVASFRFDDPDALSKRVSVRQGDPPSPWGHGMGAWGSNQALLAVF